jgi:hypothetical protein
MDTIKDFFRRLFWFCFFVGGLAFWWYAYVLGWTKAFAETMMPNLFPAHISPEMGLNLVIFLTFLIMGPARSSYGSGKK